MYDHKALLKKLPASALIVGVSLLAAVPALAGSFSDVSGLTATAGQAGMSNFDTDLASIIGRFVGALVTLLGIVFVVLLVYGGFTWMTAQGAEEKIKKAKSIISSAVIGLVVVFASYAIAQAVIGALTSATTGETPAAEEPAPPPGP